MYKPKSDEVIDKVQTDLLKIKKAVSKNEINDMNLEEVLETIQTAHSIISVQRRKLNALER